MVDNLELFNSHQEDARRRADSLAKAIFVLAGGTLTVSIGVFTGSSAPQLTPDLSCVLKTSWWALISSIVFLVITLTTILARDYAMGEKWRKQLAAHKADASGKPTAVEAVIWIFGILGILAFIGGLLCQAYVASKLV